MCRKKKNKSKKKKPSPTPNPPITFPENKRVSSEKGKEEESSPLLSLPDDLLLTCIARVSRLYYGTLSLVCKCLQSLVASPDLYKSRSLLDRTERCLYVCIWFERELQWFGLFRKPDHLTGYFLGKVPVPTRSSAEFTNLVAVGSNIYNIAGYNAPSSTVSVLDCRSHTWLEGPSLPVELLKATATVIDQKIYVAGYDFFLEKNSFQVLDTTTQMWNPKPKPFPRLRENIRITSSVCVDGKFHVVLTSPEEVTYTSREEVTYSPKDGKWKLLGKLWRGLDDLYNDSHCEVDNILYRARRGEILWFDAKVWGWRRVEGLSEQLKLPFECDNVWLADYGGKIAVFWRERFSPISYSNSLYQRLRSNKYRIWCAVIADERSKSCEILGKVESCAPVLTLPFASTFVKALAVTDL